MKGQKKSSFDEKLIQRDDKVTGNQFNPYDHSNQPYPGMREDEDVYQIKKDSDQESFEEFQYDKSLNSNPPYFFNFRQQNKTRIYSKSVFDS
jgi:hypothetical protein